MIVPAMRKQSLVLEELRLITERKEWAAYYRVLLRENAMVPATRDAFGTHWIESGHRIREQIANDRELVRLLRQLLPPYEGKTITLFRGENRARYRSGLLGLAWSSNLDTARMFGRGLNAVLSGGVLLRAQFAPTAIISGPNKHSTHLGEDQFTVDPLAATTLSAIEFYPVVT